MYLDKESLTDTFCYIEQGLSIGFDIFEDLEGQQLTNFRSDWSDEFELEFSDLSQAELWRFRAELGHFNFRAETKLKLF
jgi:hypothetical protein